MSDITVGATLYGFCNGYFGRDSYGPKRIIAKGREDGVRWVVVKNERGGIQCASGFSKEDIQMWAKEEIPDDY